MKQKKLAIGFIFLFVCLYTYSQKSLSIHEFKITSEDNVEISLFSVTNKDNIEYRPTILLLHGGGGNKELWIDRRETVQDLYNSGYNVVSMDIRGHGKSDPQVKGEFTFPITDLKAVIDWIENNNQFKSGKIGAIGSSYGSNILTAGVVLWDLPIETIVLFSVTAAAKRAINFPQNVRIPPPYKRNKIKSAFFIASDNELERYMADEMAEEFYQQTEPTRRKKRILVGRYHGSSLYSFTKVEVLEWLKKEVW
ncbi:MAG: alpha/beta fold hydrolase [Flavobacteriaceae bacterium]|nr:alpha/beta fold hydrolase [Flavobacteriaceae bacterium]